MTEQPQLSIIDLKLVLQVIDICAKRGAILPVEMKPVGISYENIQNFVKWHDANTKEAQESSSSENEVTGDVNE